MVVHSVLNYSIHTQKLQKLINILYYKKNMGLRNIKRACVGHHISLLVHQATAAAYTLRLFLC